MQYLLSEEEYKEYQEFKARDKYKSVVELESHCETAIWKIHDGLHLGAGLDQKENDRIELMRSALWDFFGVVKGYL